MSKTDVKDKDIVVPGQTLAKDMGLVAGKNTYRHGEEIIAKTAGLVDIKGRVIKIIPLSGKYIPNKFDELIGVILEAGGTGWQVNIGAPYQAYLPFSEYTKRFMDSRHVETVDLLAEGDLIQCKIVKYTKTKNLIVSTKHLQDKKLEGGIVIRVTPQKVPRIIGKQGSMITLLREKTNTNIIAGPNGWVWIKSDKPENELKAAQAIEFINQNAHKQGLTEKIEKLLK
ncbi:RNA-binding protein [archaeon CG10_big_fil_rev_8_21_14_0_10_43_11]|nr:MAG: RNA-binding protein [archaeon CG10_big_fil_rev_8_21_14_0_10_43_11]